MNRLFPILHAFVFCILFSYLFSVEQVWASPLFDGVTTLSTDTAGNGTVTISPERALYDYGEPVVLNAIPDVGWEFSSWSGQLGQIPPWWNTYWPYRIALSIEANGTARKDKLAEVSMDFTALLNQLGELGAFESESIRVVQIDSDGSILNADVPFQFDQDTSYDASTNAVGNLMILMDGLVAANEGRLYHVYFAPSGNPYFTPSFTQHITSTFTGVSDEGQQGYKFETEKATYFYHKNSGGFSSLDDEDGNDWISYDDNIPGSGGEYRGIPNMIYRGGVMTGGFHPGLGGSSSTVLNSGPLKVTYKTVDGDWEALWEIYPDVVRMTVVEAEHNYWFLYEGTPGGALDGDDFLVLSDGTQYASNANWAQDMPDDEWIYFADPDVGENGRALFLVHHEEDASVVDSYRRMNDSNGSMTVFGFGRNGLTTGISETEQTFTFGLIDETTHASAKPLIEAAYKDFGISISQPESVNQTGIYTPDASGNFTVTMNMNRVITATFVPEYYELKTTTIGNGVVNLSTPANPQGYRHGEAITITATPDAGWYFDSWSGLSTGITNSIALTITENSEITATFLAKKYELNLVQPSVGGTISASPSNTTYTYNTPIVLSAVPETGYVFGEWQGGFTGSQPTANINITDNMTVTALFDVASYEVDTQVIGEGQVALGPNQAEYEHGTIISVTAIPQEGWIFSGWSGSLSGNSANETLAVIKAESITATFVPKTFSLTTDTAGQGSIALSPQQSSYTYGSEVTAIATPAEHWKFVGWSGALSGSNATESLTVIDNHELTATFAPQEYTLSVTTQGNGNVTIEPEKQGYLAGEKVLLTAKPFSEEWILSQWSGDHSGDALTAIIEITKNTEIRAVFEEALTDIHAEVVGNGLIRVQPEQAKYEQGKPVLLIATAEPGWRFVQWDDGDTSTEKTIEVRSDRIFTATFEQESYTVSVNVIGNGRVTQTKPDAMTFSYGEELTLTAEPDTGWFFVGWQGALSGLESPSDMTIVGNTVVTATFTTSPYTLMTNTNGSGRVVVDPARPSYDLNENVTITAVAEQGWTFSGWSGDLSGTSPIAQLTITQSHSVTANFIKSDDPGIGGNDFMNVYLPLISNLP